MKEKRNNFLLRLVGVFFISTLFFFTVKTVPASVYFLMVDSILFWLVIKYSVRKKLVCLSGGFVLYRTDIGYSYCSDIRENTRKYRC